MANKEIVGINNRWIASRVFVQDHFLEFPDFEEFARLRRCWRPSVGMMQHPLGINAAGKQCRVAGQPDSQTAVCAARLLGVRGRSHARQTVVGFDWPQRGVGGDTEWGQSSALEGYARFSSIQWGLSVCIDRRTHSGGSAVQRGE